MVFSLAITTTYSTCGQFDQIEKNYKAEQERLAKANAATVDHPNLLLFSTMLADRSDPLLYTLTNAPFIGLVGTLTGAQEAYYKFELMPPSVSSNTLLQARILGGVVFRKTLFATALGAVFCATEAIVEKIRGRHDKISGMVAGAVTGFAYGGLRTWPQPFAWPVAFMLVPFFADLINEDYRFLMRGFKYYGTIPGRESRGDPEPPRPPILNTGASCVPIDGTHFWRGS